MKPEQTPKRIYLRRDAADLAMWFEKKNGSDGDIEYIRADLASPTPSLASTPDLEAIAKAIASTYYDWDDISPTEKDGYRQQAARVIAALPSPAAPGEKGKEEGGPDATLPEASPRDPKLKVQRFKISPELVDGDHWSVCNNLDQLFEAIRAWHENEPMTGDDFSVKVIEMSDEEFNAIPEI